MVEDKSHLIEAPIRHLNKHKEQNCLIFALTIYISIVFVYKSIWSIILAIVVYLLVSKLKTTSDHSYFFKAINYCFQISMGLEFFEVKNFCFIYFNL